MFDPEERTIAKLKELYPGLSDKELGEAELTLTHYFELAWEIYEESVLSKRPGQERTSGDLPSDW